MAQTRTHAENFVSSWEGDVCLHRCIQCNLHLYPLHSIKMYAISALQVQSDDKLLEWRPKWASIFQGTHSEIWTDAGRWCRVLGSEPTHCSQQNIFYQPEGHIG